MDNLLFNELIENNKVLLFFLNKNKATKTRLFTIFVVLLLPAIILFLLSSYHKTLLLRSVGFVGMIDDVLFLSIVFLAPMQLLILNTIINKFNFYLSEIPSFAKNINDKVLSDFFTKYKSQISENKKIWVVFKVLILLFFMYSNLNALYHRVGAWNSPNNILEFSITIIFVAVIIIVLMEVSQKCLQIIIAQIQLTTYLSRNNFLDIKPLSLDKSGSLLSLSELSLSFTFILVPYILSSIAHYMTWGNFSVGFAAGIIMLTFSTFFLFFFPLGTVHTLMKRSKRKFLKDVDEIYIAATDRLLVELKNNDINYNETKGYCETIKKLYDKGKEMPVWPFDLKVIVKFLTIILGPIFLIVFEMVIRLLITRFF
jgi:hypothetical protein